MEQNGIDKILKYDITFYVSTYYTMVNEGFYTRLK